LGHFEDRASPVSEEPLSPEGRSQSEKTYFEKVLLSTTNLKITKVVALECLQAHQTFFFWSSFNLWLYSARNKDGPAYLIGCLFFVWFRHQGTHKSTTSLLNEVKVSKQL
jgi:hypothetical protein